jgi:hypothetical protein
MLVEPAIPSDLRILEIGAHAEITLAFPDQTRLFWTYYKSRTPVPSQELFSLELAWRIWRDLRAGKIDLIVAWCSPYSPWNFRELKGVLRAPFRPVTNLVRIIGVQWLRLVPGAIPIIAIDNEDSRVIAWHNLFLLDRAKYFFKRELPVDRWQVFQRTGHVGLPGPRFRRKGKNRARIRKLHPISLGVSGTEDSLLISGFPPKVTDIFVGVSADGLSTVRDQGIAQLRFLAKQGIIVDFAEQRLEYRAYMQRMSHAWLSWSPEGLGWDCFRHYEAPLAWSVPIMNSPTITRYMPLLDGIHGFYYQPDDERSLAQVVKSALADKVRLEAMATEARRHVLAFHMRPRPFADLIVGAALERSHGGAYPGLTSVVNLNMST